LEVDVARRRKTEQTIFFPWERTGSLLRNLGLGRARPFVFVLIIATLFVLLALRERRMTAIRATRATIGVVTEAIDAYRADHDAACPATLDVLKTEGYLASRAEDAWGRPLRLLCPGFENPGSYDLVSDGPDGVLGGLDRVR
jgi:general secretion pathway protein G